MDVNKLFFNGNVNPTISTDSSASSETMLHRKKRTTEGKPRINPMSPVIKIKSKAKQVIAENSNSNKAGSKRKRVTISDVYDDLEAKLCVMERAGKLLSSVEDESPSFVKCLMPSNVTYGFWLILPTNFCKMNLPHHDATVILVDEWGNEYKTTYLQDRHGLSAGWRGFSKCHILCKGDIVVFQLIGPCKFKVYIVRVNGLDVVDAALCLMSMSESSGSTDSDLVNKDGKKRKKPKKYSDCFLLDVPESSKDVRKSDRTISISNTFPVIATTTTTTAATTSAAPTTTPTTATTSTTTTPTLTTTPTPTATNTATATANDGSDVLQGPEINEVRENKVHCSGSLLHHPLRNVACM